MGFTESSAFIKTAVILQLFAIVLEVFGIGLPFWISTKSGAVHTYWGLWKRCTEAGDSASCTDITGDEVEDWLKVVRGILIGALVILIGALATTLIVVFVIGDKKKKKKAKLLAWLLCVIAVGFIIVGVIIFGDESKGDDYSGAFVVTIISGVVALIAGIAGLLDWLLVQLYL